MPLSFLTAPCQHRGSFYCCSWDVAIVFQYTKTRCPDGPCVSPPTAPSCTTEGFLAIVTPGCNHGARPEYGGGGRWMWLVWVLWKDVWNRSMGIKGLGSVGGLLCWRLSPLLASMISSIDTEALLRSLCVFFFVNLFLTTPSPSLAFSHSCVSLHLPSSALFLLWVRAKESGESSSPDWVNWIDAFYGREWRWWRQVTIAVFHRCVICYCFYTV